MDRRAPDAPESPLAAVFDELVYAFARIPAAFDHRRLVTTCLRRRGGVVPYVDGPDLRLASPCGGEIVLRCSRHGRCDEVLAVTAPVVHLARSVAVSRGRCGDHLVLEFEDRPPRHLPVEPAPSRPDLAWWRRPADPDSRGDLLRLRVLTESSGRAEKPDV